MTNHSTRSIDDILTDTNFQLREMVEGYKQEIELLKSKVRARDNAFNAILSELKDQLYGEGGWPYIQVYNALGLTPLGISWDDLIKKVFDLRTAEYRMANVYELQASNERLNIVIHDKDKEIEQLKVEMSNLQHNIAVDVINLKSKIADLERDIADSTVVVEKPKHVESVSRYMYNSFPLTEGIFQCEKCGGVGNVFIYEKE